MAGFEVVVRPAVLPNIRPAPARSLPIEDAPDKGVAVINGIGNHIVDLTYSSSSSWSRQRLIEQEREFDVVRAYASSGDGGDVDKSTYIDFEVMTGVKYKKNNKDIIGQRYAKPEESDYLEVREQGVTRMNPESD